MLIVYDELCAEHLKGIPHPERPERVSAVAEALRADGLLKDCIAGRDASVDEIERAHDAGYVQRARSEMAEVRASARYLSTGDTVVDEHTLQAALRAAGGAIVAAERAYEQSCATFALIRPPGHHAESRRGMGFCVFNNAVIAARAIQAQTGARILIADFDYHHGNGTQDLSGEGVSYVSTHAYPAYPGTGGPDETYAFGTSRDAVVNVPLPPHRFGTEAFVALWEQLLTRAANAVRPDMLIVSAGFDYVAGDPVGDLGVEVAAAADLARVIARVAAEHCGGRVAYVLEGGYDIEAIARSVALIAKSSDSGETRKSTADAAAIPAAQRQLLEHPLLRR